MANPVVKFYPQPGPQSKLLACNADVCIYGGGAGGGKSYGILLDNGRWCKLDEYNAVIFRREFSDLSKPGSILSDAIKIYPLIGAKYNKVDSTFKFSEKNITKFSGLQYESDALGWQGAQLDYIGIDELTHFTEYQFWYLQSRNRSTSGNIKPYLRATCNPEPGWVKDLIEWWLDEDGYAIQERSGVMRWIVRKDDLMQWFDTETEAMQFIAESNLPKDMEPISFTFISANVYDNKKLLENDPKYLSRLYNLPEAERKKLLDCCWNVAPEGKLFKSEDFQHFFFSPNYSLKVIIADTAQEIKTANDYTVFDYWGKFENKIYKEKQIRGKFEAQDQVDILVGFIQEVRPHFVLIEQKANGSMLIQFVRKALRELGIACTVIAVQRSRDKYSRGRDAQMYIKQGYVYVNPRADYYKEWLPEIVSFAPENKNRAEIHDDQVDTMLDAIEHLLTKPINLDILKPNVNTKPKSTSSRARFSPSAYA